MRRELTAGVLAITLIAGFTTMNCNGESPLSPLPTPGSIWGVVTKAVDGTPLSAVTVSTTPTTVADTTDSLGYYVLSDLEPGTYAITAVKSGYEINTVCATLTEGDTVSADIALTISDGTVVIDWVTVPAGEFIMGSLPTDPHAQTDEQPQHAVYLDAYEIGRYEITNAQYMVFIDGGGYDDSTCWTPEGWIWRTTYSITEPYWWSEGEYNSGPAFPFYPVVGVSWHEVYAFCQWIGCRLPTEAEWEKGARADDPTNYWPWGSSWEPSNCNSYYNEEPDTFDFSSPVGYFDLGQSPYGIYDMAGNVWEWVNDWYDSEYYSISPYSNPTGPDSGDVRVFRGGGWGNIGNYLCRTADRRYHDPVGCNMVIGFRPAR